MHRNTKETEMKITILLNT